MRKLALPGSISLQCSIFAVLMHFPSRTQLAADATLCIVSSNADAIGLRTFPIRISSVHRVVEWPAERGFRVRDVK